MKAPLLDRRTASDVAAQIRQRLASYAPEYASDPQSGDPHGNALIAIAARYAELIIDRLNQVPAKNFLAFLDLLGASQQPPQPARVPLTFFLAAGTVVPAVVPAATQVAAPPKEGETDPIIFETERVMVATPAVLTAVFTRDPLTDRFADLTVLAPGADGLARPLFAGDRPLDHFMCIGLAALLGFPGITSLEISFGLGSSQADPRETIWETWDGSMWTKVDPASDETNDLQQNGTVAFGPLAPIPLARIAGVESRWLRCRLRTPITRAPDAVAGSLRASQLPAISSISARAVLRRTGIPVDLAFTNAVAIDISKDFFPFGETPRFGDTWFVRCDEALSIADATVTLHIDLTNPADGTSKNPKPATAGEDGVQLIWEVWDGSRWRAAEGTTDTTSQLTKSGGTVTVTCPPSVAPALVNGVEGYWLRARIAAGDYGHEARYVRVDDKDESKGFKLQPATFAPPVIKLMSVEYALDLATVPDALLTFNDFAFADVSTAISFQPFTPTNDASPTAYLGFELPSGVLRFPNQPVSLFVEAANIPYTTPVQLVWEYATPSGWSALTVRDDTQSLTRSGVIEFLAPADFAVRSEFGVSARFWVRVRQDGRYAVMPQLSRLLLNTTMAAQTVTVRDEIIGSSDGTKHQQRNTTRAPILPGQSLDVREEGEIWVRWTEVPDFYGSRRHDRHYVVDRLGGRILFGDGRNGLVPPIGINNLRLTHYQTGGGRAGNRAAGTIVQLKTTVPYVDKVTNIEPADGGADAEPLPAVSDRVPRELRHGGRAVTVEDYEDLAREASREVARAKCIPLIDLAANANGDPVAHPETGNVSVIIVPVSTEAMPVPSEELRRRVQQYLDSVRSPTVRLSVVGPQYVQVTVTTEVVPVSLDAAANVLSDVQTRLYAFLHPLTGGVDGQGWDFGRLPHQSDMYALIGTVPGVDHVRALAVTTDTPIAEMPAGRFLVYSGTHNVSVVFKEI